MRPEKTHNYDTTSLPGTSAGASRIAFLKDRPALKLAYDALNDVAQKYVDKNGIDLIEVSELGAFHGAMERLFESSNSDKRYPEDDPLLERDDLLKIIKKAKRKIREAASN